MGFSETITEIARRAATGDSWYVEEFPYALELVSGAVSQVFVLPHGPEAYSVKRVLRQSVSPTMGGVVAEEQGLLWREITVSGSFFLTPVAGYDTTGIPLTGGFRPDDLRPAGPTGALSGPAWTRRLARNVFEHYGALKADPTLAAQTYLVWHDMKTDDHWVVVPLELDVSRTLQRRLQYPYSFQLRTIGDADSLLIPQSPVSLIDKLRNAVADVAAAVDLANAAVQEGTATLGEVQIFAAQVDSILDGVTTVIRSAQDFVQGVTDTISVGATFISSVATGLEEMNVLLEDIAEVPAAVRANYQRAVDALDAIAAQKGAFGQSYSQQAGVQADLETATRDKASATELEAARTAGPPTSMEDQDLARIRSTDADLVEARRVASQGRTFPRYQGARQYTVRGGDTLPAIAARELGDGSRWFDLALVNDLSPPYISASGAPGTVRVGDTLTIPQLQPVAASAVASRGQGSEPAEDLLGTDWRLVPSPNSQPGRLLVDWAIDRRTAKDFRLVSGFANLEQALQVRLATERGTMPLSPDYGLRRVVGYGSTAADLTALRVAFRETLLADSRVQQVAGIRLEADGDQVIVDADVVPIGTDTARGVSALL